MKERSVDPILPLLIAALLVPAAVVFTVVSGCTKQETPIVDQTIAEGRFVASDDSTTSKYTIFIDRETGVQYLRVSGGISVIVDQDGKPLIAEGYDRQAGDPAAGDAAMATNNN